MFCPIYINKDSNDHAIIENNNQLTYSELNEKIYAYQTQLKLLNISKGSHIGFVIPGSIESIAMLFACFREQIVAVLINSKQPESTIVETLRKTNCKYYIKNEPIIITQNCTLITLKTDTSKQSNTTPNTTLSLDRKASILCSSGSTGEPKFIVHSLKNHIINAKESKKYIPITKHDRYLLSLPIHHISGLSILFRIFLSQASVVINTVPLEKSISTQNITHCSLTNMQLNMLLGDDYRLEKIKKTSLKACILGGSHFPKKAIESIKKSNIAFYLTYGCSECTSQISCTQLSPSSKAQKIYI